MDVETIIHARFPNLREAEDASLTAAFSGDDAVFAVATVEVWAQCAEAAFDAHDGQTPLEVTARLEEWTQNAADLVREFDLVGTEEQYRRILAAQEGVARYHAKETVEELGPLAPLFGITEEALNEYINGLRAKMDANIGRVRRQHQEADDTAAVS